MEKELFKVVMFCKAMINNGEPVGLACYKAGQYYGYSKGDVARGLNNLKGYKDKKEN